MSDTMNTAPDSVRRLETASANRLVRAVAAYEDMQTVLRCCERLVTMLADPRRGDDDVEIDALWTLALLSYARGFTGTDGNAAVTTDDLPDPKDDGEPVRAHQVYLHLRDHHASAETNPREVYTVGVAQGEDGTANALAVTSVRTPRVDDVAVRRLGALAYPLCGTLDDRIGAMQKTILDEMRGVSQAELDKLERIEVAPGT